jgi:hypothetical protein
VASESFKSPCNSTFFKKGVQHPRFAGPRRIDTRGYVSVYAPNHPKAHAGRVPEHILLVERALGHPMPVGSEVHHVDEDKQNNSCGNLVLCPNREYHRLMEMRTRALDACGNPNYRLCYFCGTYADPSTMRQRPTSYVHIDCHNAYQRRLTARRRA